MATQPQIEAVVDAVIAAFDGDPALWTAFLERSKLETELAQLESQKRVLLSAFDQSAQAHQDQVNTLIEAEEAKKAEIDALT